MYVLVSCNKRPSAARTDAKHYVRGNSTTKTLQLATPTHSESLAPTSLKLRKFQPDPVPQIEDMRNLPTMQAPNRSDDASR